MIFVTVGTHEQQFNRLVEEVDKLKEDGTITEDVFIQTGFSTYEPKHCQWSKLISYKEMNNKIKEARIIITHGGPASFIAPLQIGKIPIVVPRQEKFGEHVNDHQLEFAKNVEERNKNIIPVYDIKDLKEKILDYDKIIEKMDISNVSNNENFCIRFEKEIQEMLAK